MTTVSQEPATTVAEPDGEAGPEPTGRLAGMQPYLPGRREALFLLGGSTMAIAIR